MYHKNPIIEYYPFVHVLLLIIEFIHVPSSSEIHLTRLNSDSNLINGKIPENGSIPLEEENSTSIRSAASMHIYNLLLIIIMVYLLPTFIVYFLLKFTFLFLKYPQLITFLKICTGVWNQKFPIMMKVGRMIMYSFGLDLKMGHVVLQTF